jgi:CHAT domain-containing protein/tetratricopeptide (TPR) repeat protein
VIGAAAAVALLVAWARPAASGQNAAQDEAAIRAAITRFYDAYGREDVDGVKSAWSSRVPGLERLIAAFAPTISGKDYSFEDLAISRIEIQSNVASARATVAATIVDIASARRTAERWVRNFMFVRDPEGWRVWRDASAAEDVALEIRSATSAAEARAIVDREPDLMVGEVCQALFGLGNRLRGSGRAEDADKVYHLSAWVAEQSGDPIVLGRSHTNSGVNLQLVAEYDRALQEFETARALFEEAGDKAGIAGTESNIGSALYLSKRYPEAVEHFHLALAYYEQEDQKGPQAGAFHNIGNAQYLAGDYAAALASYHRGLGLLESTADVIGAANTLQAIGLVQTEQGDYDAALESYSASLARHEKYGNDAGRGVVLAGLGEVHRLMGDSSRALDRYFEALPLLEQMGERETLGSVLGDIAGVYAAERRYTQALAFFERSLVVAEKTGNKAEMARVVAGTGAVYFAQARYAQAMEQYERGLGLFREARNKAGVAWTLVHMGLVHQAERRLVEAQTAYEESLAVVEELNDQASVAIALALVARTRAALDRPHEGLALARQAAAVAGEIGELDTLARARLVAGEIGIQLGETDQARHAFADAVAALEQLQQQGGGAERDRFFGDTLAPYLGLVRLAAAEGRARDGLAWLERGKAYLLRQAIGGTGALVTRGMSDSEREREHTLARRLVSLTTQIQRERRREMPDRLRLDDLLADLDKTRLERAAFTAALYDAHPALKVLRGQGEAGALGEQPGFSMAASSAILELAVGEEQTHLFVVRTLKPSSGPSVTVRVLDVKAVELAAKIAQFRALIAARDPRTGTLARELYDLLLKPAESDLAGATRLVVVPDAVTWALPFQALQPRAGRYVIEDRAVSYAPSLAAFVEMTRPAGRTTPAGALALSAAAFGLASPGEAASRRLIHLRPDVKMDAAPEAPKEAVAVARLYSGNRANAFVGDAATRTNLVSEAAACDVLHVATPGALNDSSPLTSQIVLTQAAASGPDDGLLETNELMDLDLRADVVFFSRLRGEPGQARAGEAAVALAWAAFVAGTPTTVISSWCVDAPSTTVLALRFHRALGAGVSAARTSRLPAAEALRRAALALLAVPATRHPYYWAGFSVFGR